MVEAAWGLRNRLCYSCLRSISLMSSITLSSWVGDVCCSWYGVYCGNTSASHVIELDLRSCTLKGNRLAGRIPDKIGKLYKLKSRDLSKNGFSGPIPQSLSELNSLSSLNLSFNDLSGRIPTGNQLQTFNDRSIYALATRNSVANLS